VIAMHQCICDEGACREGYYYVSGADTDARSRPFKWWPLLGPYRTHLESLDQVERGRKLAEQENWRAAFWAFGTVQLGVARRTVFGR